MTDLPLALIAAVGRNGVIGADNGLPWRMPSDLKHFRRTTLGKPVLMGRKTFGSIGRPLPGRFVIVLSRDRALAPEGVAVAGSIDAAIALATSIGRQKGAEEIMVAGGGTLYEALIGRARRLYLTEVDLAPLGDTRFPALDEAAWRVIARDPHPAAPGDEAGCSFVVYERR